MPRPLSELLQVDPRAGSVRPRERSARWLREALQRAVELELFTIPPYLCAYWSIKNPSPSSYFVWSLRTVHTQEMKHVAQACNLLTAFGWVPVLNRPPAVPRYPGPLPGGVHPGLRVALRPLSKDLLGSVFMPIEFPSPDAVTAYGERSYPTIGAFYGAIAEVIADQSVPIVGGPQLDGGLHPISVTSYPTALAAVELIRSEGEGAGGSPFLADDGLAHYYRFAEMFWGRRIGPCGDGGWGFCGPPLDFPTPADVYPMAPVPEGGYPAVPAARAFNRKYTQILDLLQAAWEAPAGGEARLGEAVGLMTETGPGGMTGLARALMDTPRRDGAGNYGPDFRYLRGCRWF